MGQVTNSAVSRGLGLESLGFAPTDQGLPAIRTADGPHFDVNHFKGGRNYVTRHRGAVPN